MEPDSQNTAPGVAPAPPPADSNPIIPDSPVKVRPYKKRRHGVVNNKGRMTSGYKQKMDMRSTAHMLHQLATNVMMSPSPNRPPNENGEVVCRALAILENLADRAEKGDNAAVEILFDRMGGRVRSVDNAPAETGGRIVIEWAGPPPAWMPAAAQPAALNPAQQAPPAHEPQRGREATTAPSCQQNVIDAEVCDAEKG